MFGKAAFTGRRHCHCRHLLLYTQVYYCDDDEFTCIRKARSKLRALGDLAKDYEFPYYARQSKGWKRSEKAHQWKEKNWSGMYS